MITILDKIKVQDLLDCYQPLESGIVWTDYGHKGRQTSLQYQHGDDPWTSCVGRSKGNETGYSFINPYFEGTLFQTVIEKYSLFRTRLIWLGPYACYSMHRDSTKRIHIPLITNTECYFIFKNGKIEHLPVGCVYQVDTRFYHTFANCSETPRLHLVGIVED